MAKRMTWDEIKKRYPHQHVGLIDIEELGDNSISAIVKYTLNDISRGEMFEKACNGEIHMRYTTVDEDEGFVL